MDAECRRQASLYSDDDGPLYAGLATSPEWEGYLQEVRGRTARLDNATVAAIAAHGWRKRNG